MATTCPARDTRLLLPIAGDAISEGARGKLTAGAALDNNWALAAIWASAMACKAPLLPEVFAKEGAFAAATDIASVTGIAFAVESIVSLIGAAFGAPTKLSLICVALAVAMARAVPFGLPFGRF